ncbi:AAA family ATPase, partial [Bradyrhizobium vignae]
SQKQHALGVSEHAGDWKLRYPTQDALLRDFTRVWSKFAQPKDVEREANARSAEAFVRNAQTPEMVSRPLIAASEFVPQDPSLIPVRETLHGGHYNRRFLSATFGVGGGGKSALAIAESISMATGIAILGSQPAKALRVWYFNLEDPPDELQRRFIAAAKHHGIDQQKLAENLFVDSGRNQELIIVKKQGRETVVVNVLMDALIDEARRQGIDVLILDPAVSIHQVDENSNNEVQVVASQLTRVAQEANLALEVVHHVNKSSGDGKAEVTAESGRGAGALKDKARAVRAINSMSEKEAKKAGIDPKDRFSYFRVTSAKSNMAKRSGHPDWYRIVSVDLGNGTKWSAGDSVGVVEKWKWPSETDTSDDITAEELEEIKRQISLGAHGDNHQAKDWAGLVFSNVLGLDAKADKRKIGQLMKALVKAAHFVVAERKSEKGRHRPMYEVAQEPHHPPGGVGSGAP